MSSFQLLGSWVGLLGGASGFIAVLLQWRSIYVEAPRIKVEIKFAINPITHKEFYSIDVVNRGGKEITINSVGIEFNSDAHSPFNMYPEHERVGPDFAFRLASHSAQTWLVGKGATLLAAQELNARGKIRATATVATGKLIKSRHLQILSKLERNQ